MIHEQLSGKIIGAAMNVLNELRAGRHITCATGEMIVEIGMKLLGAGDSSRSPRIYRIRR